MCGPLYAANINIDYFPTNFILQDGALYYVDYECNEYMEEWNFENWGVKYWSKTPEFLKDAEERCLVEEGESGLCRMYVYRENERK